MARYHDRNDSLLSGKRGDSSRDRQKREQAEKKRILEEKNIETDDLVTVDDEKPIYLVTSIDSKGDPELRYLGGQDKGKVHPRRLTLYKKGVKKNP